jgi:hypothetical protein
MAGKQGAELERIYLYYMDVEGSLYPYISNFAYREPFYYQQIIPKLLIH